VVDETAPAPVAAEAETAVEEPTTDEAAAEAASEEE
jgi:hypothetical protein